MGHSVTRFHDFSYGHRVAGHEGKCRHLHGHNGRVHFTCVAKKLDPIGRVVDFSVMKDKLCNWVEKNWDHKFLAWEHDPLMNSLRCSNFKSENGFELLREDETLRESIVFTPFNPTAESMAEYLCEVVGPKQLAGTGIRLIAVRLDETIKCSANYRGGNEYL